MTKFNCTGFLIIGWNLLATTTDAQTAIEKSATTHVKEWADALNRNDAEKVMAFYENSKDLMVLTSSGTKFKGFKAMKEGFIKDFKEIQFSDSGIKNVNARTLGDLVILDFEHRFKLMFQADKSRWQIHIRTTSVVKKKNGQWKIVHEHSSAIHGTERITRLDQ